MKTFQLVDKKQFKIPSLADFQWSPTDNRLAYWTAEDGNVPARVVLAEVIGVKLEEARSKVCIHHFYCFFELTCFFVNHFRHYLMLLIVNYVGKNVVIILLLKLIDIRRRVERRIIQNIRYVQSFISFSLFIYCKKSYDSIKCSQTLILLIDNFF